MLSKSSFDPEAQICMLQEETNLFLIGKIVLIVMVPILINRGVFEPSYNDLKSQSKTAITLYQPEVLSFKKGFRHCLQCTCK